MQIPCECINVFLRYCRLNGFISSQYGFAELFYQIEGSLIWTLTIVRRWAGDAIPNTKARKKMMICPKAEVLCSVKVILFKVILLPEYGKRINVKLKLFGPADFKALFYIPDAS